MKEFLIMPLKDGEVTFDAYGKVTDRGIALLQRLYVMLLTDSGKAYWNTAGYKPLLDLLEGHNAPSRAALQAYVTAAFNGAFNRLDTADKAMVSSRSATCDDDLNVYITLTFADSTTLQGKVNINA